MVFPDGVQYGQITGFVLLPGLAQRRSRVNFTIDGVIKGNPAGALPGWRAAQLPDQSEGGMALLTDRQLSSRTAQALAQGVASGRWGWWNR